MKNKNIYSNFNTIIIIFFFYQLDTQIIYFLIQLLLSSACFEHYCAHPQELKLYYYSIWYRHSL